MNAFQPMLNDDITPFQIAVAEAQLTDLRERLTMTRWPASVADDWSRGQPVGFIRELAGQWLHFDWRAREAELNRYPHYLTEIDGQRIHFVHVASKEPDALPLILTHGWPSTFYEYYPVIELLTNPRGHGLDPGLSFDVMIPSVPGYGFSSPLTGPGWDSARTARAWDTLMKRLGYARYGAQGGDAGALITRELGALAPDGLVGAHLQQVFAFPNGTPGEIETPTPLERDGFANLDGFQKYAGYQLIQQRRLATLGYGLVDSPVALLAWNAEPFFGFGGEGAQSIDRERYLTHVSIFWFTGTGGPAANLYFEDSQTGAGNRKARNGTTEAPELLVEDLRAFFASVR